MIFLDLDAGGLRVLSRNCLGNVWSIDVSSHFLRKTVSMFFLTIYYCSYIKIKTKVSYFSIKYQAEPLNTTKTAYSFYYRLKTKK